MHVIKKPSFNVSVISFDLDDTLWPVEPIIEAAELNFYAELQRRYPRISAALSSEQIRQKRIKFMQDRPHLHHDLSSLRAQFIDDLLNRHDYPSDCENSLMRGFLTDRNKVDFYPGTLEALRTLAKHYKLVACTNGNADVFQTTAGEFFSHSVSSERAGVAKPDKNIFDLLCKELNCRAPDILHIGDNPQTDALGALHAGMHSVWFNPQQQPWPHPQAPHATITHLDQLLPLLKSRNLS